MINTPLTIYIIITLIIIILFTGCIETTYTKTGTIIKIEEYGFGLTFSDHMTILTYSDNTTLELTGHYNNYHRYIKNKKCTIEYTKFTYNNIKYNRFEKFTLIQ